MAKKEVPQKDIPSIYEAFETDTDAEVDGQWVRGIREGMNVLVARWGNPRYRKMFSKLIKPVRQQFDRGTLSEEEITKLTTQCMAETILLDWDGPAFVTREGEPLEFSREAAVKLMTDLPDFRDELVALARESETFRIADREESVGN